MYANRTFSIYNQFGVVYHTHCELYYNLHTSLSFTIRFFVCVYEIEKNVIVHAYVSPFVGGRFKNSINC